MCRENWGGFRGKGVLDGLPPPSLEGQNKLKRIVNIMEEIMANTPYKYLIVIPTLWHASISGVTVFN